MSRRIVSLALALVMAAALIPTFASADIVTKYVYTDNGKGVNVRSSPNSSDRSNIIGALNFGDAVGVEASVNGWSVIVWGSYGSAYVYSRFLVDKMPTAKPAPAAKTAKTTTKTATAAPAANGLSDINAEFRTAVKVAVPYMVVARPSRASGWVNLRWAPSTEANRITTCPQGYELRVLVEMKSWYQVEDPQTGMIGFISRKYVNRK